MNRPLRVAVLALAAGLFGVAVHFDVPLCPMASSFGIPCPGCGLTRATLALLHGDVRTALHFHPLVWLLTPLFAGFMGVALFDLLRDPARPRRASRLPWSARTTSAIGLVVFVLIVGVWLARFGGYFGGPAPVTTMYHWLDHRI